MNTTSQPPASERPLFSPKALKVFIFLGVLSLAVSLGLTLSQDPLKDVNSDKQDIFSKSAVGHKALFEWLDKSGVDVEISTYHTNKALVRDPALLILAEPMLYNYADELQTKRVIAMKAAMVQAPATLLVIPKWKASYERIPGHPQQKGVYNYTFREKGWLPNVERAPSTWQQQVLGRANIAASINTSDDGLPASGWDTSITLPVDPSLTYLQVLDRNSSIEPVIWNSQGVLLGKTKHPTTGRPLFVLSDPDLLANHGLQEARNRDFVLHLIKNYMLPASGTTKVLVDETTHGHLIPPTLAQRMRQKPLIYLSIQLGLLAIFLLWAGIFRFGRPKPRVKSQATGTHYLLEHTAQLMSDVGDPSYSVEHYVEQTLRDVGERLGAPGHLSLKHLVQWLQNTSQERGVLEHDLQAILNRAQDQAIASDGRDRNRRNSLLLPALHISQWKRSILQ